MIQTTIEAALAEAKEAKARQARGETALTSSIEMKHKILELAQSLSSDDRQWLLERLQPFAQDHQLPENLTLEEAIHFYQTNQCNLGKAAELAGVTRWQLQDILYQRGTPGTLGSDLTLDEIDALVNLLEAEYTGHK